MILPGSFLRTMWDIFRAVSFGKSEIIIEKMKKKILRLLEIDFLCGKDTLVESLILILDGFNFDC